MICQGAATSVLWRSESSGVGRSRAAAPTEAPGARPFQYLNYCRAPPLMLRWATATSTLGLLITASRLLAGSRHHLRSLFPVLGLHLLAATLCSRLRTGVPHTMSTAATRRGARAGPPGRTLDVGGKPAAGQQQRPHLPNHVPQPFCIDKEGSQLDLKI